MEDMDARRRILEELGVPDEGPLSIEELLTRFTYHNPVGGQPETYRAIRRRGLDFAAYLAATCPPSRELSLAITKLEEVVMWANASIARREPADGPRGSLVEKS